jgi:hypothetical protein
MRTNVTIASVVSGVLLCAMLCDGQSPLPSADLPTITATIQRDFSSIDEIRTISMTDDPDGRFDIIVVGTRRESGGGWRVEAIGVDHHQLRKRWDSVISAREPEFESSGRNGIDVRKKDYDYDILIQGCVARECGDGIDGFLVFSGRAGKTYKAKVVTQGLDKPVAGASKYDVTFSTGISDEAKRILQDAICSSSAISNKPGLPFECKSP